MIQTQRTLLAAVVVLALLVAAHLLDRAHFGRANVVMVYMLVVVVVSALMGLWPAVVVSLLGVPLFYVFDVPPYFNLSPSELQHTFTLGVLLSTAVVVSSLAARLRLQARESELRAMQAAALYTLSAELAADLDEDEILRVTTRHVERAFDITLGQVRDLAALHGVLPGRESQPHLQAMIGLAEQAMARSALRRRLQETELRAQRETLRSSILGAVSHDLRTPLASIIGASSGLLDGSKVFAPEAREKLGSVIYNEALQMQRMVENLLDYARLRSGGVGTRKEWQAIEELVGSALAAVRRRVPGRRIVVNVPDTLPLLRCDGVLLERVITNLVENALKFSPPDSTVTVEAKALAGEIEFSVTDQGQGVPEGLREQIFEPFARFGLQEGSGLGLAICRGIVEAHGGSVRVEAPADGGARFVVRLPLPGELPVPPAREETTRSP